MELARSPMKMGENIQAKFLPASHTAKGKRRQKLEGRMKGFSSMV
jgi:hypothetical protein